uniref:Uncharacterized protein n=1 Tax=Arundo donax TaxID=35708 RepID=A0A0A9C8X3_ARUDO
MESIEAPLEFPFVVFYILVYKMTSLC